MRADEAACSGNSETCTSAKDGHGGAQGQPGGTGASGFSDGSDALVTFFEFTEAAWDDLMTRPWITQVSPPKPFPATRSSSARCWRAVSSWWEEPVSRRRSMPTSRSP